MNKSRLVPVLNVFGVHIACLKPVSLVTDGEEVLWQSKAPEDAETSSLIGLAWLGGRKGNLSSAWSRRSYKSNVFHVKDYEQKKYYSRQTASAQNRGSSYDNQHAR